MVAALVGLTHGLRVLGRLVGPYRSGILLGLPSTTAVILLGVGRAHGPVAASELADASLLGLVGTVALPMTYAWAIGSGTRWGSAIVLSVAAYLAITLGVRGLGLADVGDRLAVSTIAVLAACSWAARLQPETRPPRRRRRSGPGAPHLLIRTLVPVACLGSITLLRKTMGVEWAGLFGTFPGLSLTLLVVTHLESGAAEARKFARGLPPGNLAMVAFLAVFRFVSRDHGLSWGASAAYGAALMTLSLVEFLNRWGFPALSQVFRLLVERLRDSRGFAATRSALWGRFPPPSPRRHPGISSYLPGVEALA
jgi:hypothetical protein